MRREDKDGNKRYGKEGKKEEKLGGKEESEFTLEHIKSEHR